MRSRVRSLVSSERSVLTLDRELQKRLVAARNYAGYSQQVMGDLLGGLDKRKIMEYERGDAELRRFEVRTVIAGYAELCEVPEAWFTADWSQLDPGYQPPEDELADLTDKLSEVEKHMVDREHFEHVIGLLRQAVLQLSAQVDPGRSAA